MELTEQLIVEVLKDVGTGREPGYRLVLDALADLLLDSSSSLAAEEFVCYQVMVDF